jgi:hypothetical membrane protein
MLVPAGCIALAAGVIAGTLANRKPLLITPISLLHNPARSGPAGWAFEAILLVVASLTGLCFLRWRRFRSGHRVLGILLAISTGLCLLLIGLPFPESRWHENVAILLMASIAAHSVFIAWYFRHPALPPAALVTTIALLFFLTAKPPLVGIGEHLLLLCAMPGVVLCYGAERPPPQHEAMREAGSARMSSLVAALFEKRAALSGCIWAGLVVTVARVFNALEPGLKAVITLALPCWVAGAVASYLAWAFPHRFTVRALGAAIGFVLTGLTGGIHSMITAALLLGFGLPLVGGVHWLSQEVEDRGL